MEQLNMELSLVQIKKEITTQLSDVETFNSLLKTTFKGLKPELVKTAMMDGMMQGFKFEDFLKKHVYAIGYGETYSLVTSIDHARKIGMRSGIVGKSAPTFEMDGKDVASCTITVKRKINEYVGEYTATVFFDEYSTGKNLWKSKPKTMIAKVAEMHALRMACPEELSQSYVEEEMERGEKATPVAAVDITQHEASLRAATSLEGLQEAWSGLPGEAKATLLAVKDEMKKKYENK
jgi:hypothetical protein